MPHIHKNTCPVCDQKIFSGYLVCKDYYASKEDFQLVECTNCGFVMTQDFPSEDEIGKYYNIADEGENAAYTVAYIAMKML